MAVCQLNNGKSIEVTPQQGHDMWLVLQGEKQPTEAQAEFALKIKRLYLNWRRDDLPESYYSHPKNKQAIEELRRLHSISPPPVQYAQGKMAAYKDD